ncbi:post-transcriptional regulator [Halobacillus seohaensis]|uniref:Post-transcriptional regulator n=1 Tax=Halobacillus seohaensis TaxID=447421 RepID=A0ABW2EIN0_9BACI
MEDRKPVSQWRKTVELVLNSKKEEFKLLGYNKATTEDVWQCLHKKVWKNDPPKRLYEIVQDIFHLSNNLFVSYITVEAYRNDDLMASIEALENSSSQKQ